MAKLSDYGSRTYSQYGEDGIIARIFEVIGTTSRVCVEVGAWDGFHLSNVANLWTKGWKGVLIECDAARFQELERNTKGHKCICVNAAVTAAGDSTIEAILGRTGTTAVDLLSIDVDGDDYYLFESLRRFRPRVVIVEYNPTIPAHVDLFAAPGNYFGCSVAALERLAAERRYRLVSVTDTNAFFVVEEEFPKFAEYDTERDALRIDRHLTYLITSFAGDYVLHGRPLFRLNLPYRGRLFGDHIRVRFRPRLLRLARLPGKIRRELRAWMRRR